MSLPITLMVDDPAPLINVYWWHVRMKGGMGHPDGRPVARDDYLWAVMESLAEGPEFVGRVADRFITADGKRGRLVELFAAGTPIVFFTHWQCLFCDGREVGLQVLDEVCRRIDAVWGRQVRWLKCSELAAEIAAGIDWTNSP